MVSLWLSLFFSVLAGQKVEPTLERRRGTSQKTIHKLSFLATSGRPTAGPQQTKHRQPWKERSPLLSLGSCRLKKRPLQLPWVKRDVTPFPPLEAA